MGGTTVVVLVLLTAVATVSAADDSEVKAMIKEGSAMKATGGRNVTLNCYHQNSTVNVTGAQWSQLLHNQTTIPIQRFLYKAALASDEMVSQNFLPFTKEDAGTYQCTIFYNDSTGQQQNSTANIAISYYPPVEVVFLDKQKVVMLEESAKLNCTITKAYDGRIIWSRIVNGSVMTSTQLDGNITSRWTMEAMNFTLGGQRNASLQIVNVTREDDGEYRCMAFNEIDEPNYASIILKVRGKWDALWPFLGFLAEVLLLCGIIFLCERRRNKKLAKEVVIAEQVPLTQPTIIKKTTTTITTASRT